MPWPDAVAADYRAKGYWAGVPLGALLRAVADRTPDAAAVRLLDLGMGRGDRIVVQLATAGSSWS